MTNHFGKQLTAVILSVIILLMTLLTVPAMAEQEEAKYTLAQVVILSRHNLRPAFQQ